MKHAMHKPVLAVLFLAISAMLFSFKPLGGEGFQVLINNKVVLERFGKDMDAIKTLQLDQYAPDAKVTIKYYHCGKVGKNRTLTVRDENNKVIKQWKYQDSETAIGISCTVKDLTEIQKKHASLSVHYASTELPQGRCVASLQSTAVAVKN